MYKLTIYKKDRRCKSGYRVVAVVPYPNASGNSMMDECKYLRQTKYKPKDGYKLDW
jgi:hypothetical protein